MVPRTGQAKTKKWDTEKLKHKETQAEYQRRLQNSITEEKETTKQVIEEKWKQNGIK